MCEFQDNELRGTQIDLIRRFIKPCFSPAVIEWAEKTTETRMIKFLNLLDYAAGYRRERELDLSTTLTDPAFGGPAGFGLTYSFAGHRSCRKINPLRFTSPNITDNGIFGYPSPKSHTSRSLPPKTMTICHLSVQRMFRPEVVPEVLKYADDYATLLQDISRYIETAQSSNPRNQRARTASYGTRSIQPLTLSRGIETPDLDTPRKEKLSFSLRNSDTDFQRVYKTDSRWSPRITMPSPQSTQDSNIRSVSFKRQILA